jgi:hypothetical protein
MATIYLNTPELVDAAGEGVTYDAASSAYRVPFVPKPLGSTEKLYVKVSCVVVPAITVKARFTLSLIYPEYYRFVQWDGRWEEEITTGVHILIPFKLERISPTGFTCQMKLVVRDKAAGSTTSLPQYINIKDI